MRPLFSRGFNGLSDTLFSGVAGSVYRSVGIDHRSKPGVLRPHQALAKHSSTTIDELCKVSVNVSDGSKLWFSSESGKIWREVSGTYTLLDTLEYPPLNLGSLSANGDNADVSAKVEVPYSIQFKPDGTKMFIYGDASLSAGGNYNLFEYALSTAWDISTATYSEQETLHNNLAHGFWIKSDGLKLYMVTSDGSIVQYSLGSAWDITTVTADGITYDYTTESSEIHDIQFNSTGTKMIAMSTGTNELIEYSLSTAWDITTLAVVDTVTITDPEYGLTISSDGLTLMFIDSDDNAVQYIMTTAFDLSSIEASVLNIDLESIGGNGTYRGIAFIGDDSAVYIGDSSSDSIKGFTVIPDYIEGETDATVRSAREWKVTNGSVGEDKVVTNYIYFTSTERLSRIDVSDIGSTWTPNIEYVGKFLNGGELHTMGVANNTLFIGDANILSSVSNLGVFTLQPGFNLPEGEVITSVSNFDIDTLIGTDNGKTGRVLRWDGISTDISADDDIYVQGGVQAFISDDNYRYVIDGEGTIWFYNGEQCEVAYRIPEIGDGTIKVNANAVGYWRKTPIFGVSNGSGNTVLQGIYALGKYSRGYDTTLSLDFPMPSGEFAGVEIGSIIIDGQDMYVSWKDGEDSGVAKLDYTTKYASAYIETMALSEAEERHQLKTLTDVVVPFYSKPASTNITIGVDKNYSGSFAAMTVVEDTKRKVIELKTPTVVDCANPRIRIGFTTNNNDSVEIEDVLYNIAPLGKK